MNSKIIIGSANFGQVYGISKNRINLDNAKNICNYAIKKKVKFIDTASSYKNSHKIISNLDKRLQVITKILPCKKWKNFDYCLKKIQDIKIELKNKDINTILFHDEKFLLKKKSFKIYKNLEKLKKKGFYKNLGVSIYDFRNVKFLIKKYKIDVIQCPFNIFDQRLVSTNLLPWLRSKKIKVHVRSIFLQGLLLDSKYRKNSLFKTWENELINLNNYINENNLKIIDLCMSFVNSYNIDGYIVGIDSIKNLKEIMNFKKIKRIDFNIFAKKNKKLIDPRKWK